MFNGLFWKVCGRQKSHIFVRDRGMASKCCRKITQANNNRIAGLKQQRTAWLLILLERIVLNYKIRSAAAHNANLCLIFYLFIYIKFLVFKFVLDLLKG